MVKVIEEFLKLSEVEKQSFINFVIALRPALISDDELDNLRAEWTKVQNIVKVRDPGLWEAAESVLSNDAITTKQRSLVRAAIHKGK